MKNSVIIIIFGLLWTSLLLGQVQNDVKAVLSKKDFVSFKNFADTLSSSEQNISCHWTVFRDITTDYKEGVFYITKSVPDSKNPAISSIYTFRVRVLASDKTIIYYDLGEKRNKKVKKEWVPYYDTLDYYKNDSLFAILRQSFFKSFDGELNETELFIDDLVYGQACGIIGEDPKEKMIIDNLVATKNKEEILKWIKSTNFEKQIYAVDGLYQLKENGTTYTSEELKIIKNVLDKKGTIFHCRGCVYSWTDVRMVTYKFKFE
jgi:hypothetical protein